MAKDGEAAEWQSKAKAEQGEAAARQVGAPIRGGTAEQGEAKAGQWLARRRHWAAPLRRAKAKQWAGQLGQWTEWRRQGKARASAATAERSRASQRHGLGQHREGEDWHSKG